MLEEIIKAHAPDSVWFWRTHAGAELDLMMLHGSTRTGVEIKRMDAPTLTPSMRIAREDLRLDRLVVVYPGERSYGLGEGVEVVPVSVFCR